MAKGKKTDYKVIHDVMYDWFYTGNCSETARRLNMPKRTVDDLVNAHKDDEAFAKLRQECTQELSSMAKRTLHKTMRLMERKIDRALTKEEELDTLIEEILATDRSELTDSEKQALIKKLRSMQLQDVKAISSAFGTIYDRVALEEGGATERVIVEVKMPEGAEDFGG